MAASSFVVPSYWLTLLIYIGINALVCVGLVMMTGYAGITSFGQAAFVGLGAYTTALLTTGLQLSPWLSLPASIAVTMRSPWPSGGSPCDSPATISCSAHSPGASVSITSSPMSSVLGGYNGISGLPPLFSGGGADERIPFNILVWGCGRASSADRHQHSRQPAGARDPRGPLAGDGGILRRRTARYKLVVFVLAAAAAGLAGWLHAHFLRFVNPNPFHLNASVEYLFMTIIGGVSSLLGAIAGSMIVVVTKSWLQGAMPGLIRVTGNYEIVAFGVVVLLLLHFAPKGVMAIMPQSFRLSSKLDRRAHASLPEPRPSQSAAPKCCGSRMSPRISAGCAPSIASVCGICAREMVALVGPNGAGKSTLFDMVSGLTPLSSGAIRC